MLWMWESGCRDNPSGSFSGETTQIHCVPAFSSTIGPRTLGCQFMCMSCVPLVCLSVHTSTNNLLPNVFQTLCTNTGLDLTSPCAVSLEAAGHSFHRSVNMWDTSVRPVHFFSVVWALLSPLLPCIYRFSWVQRSNHSRTGAASTREEFFLGISSCLSLSHPFVLLLSSLHSVDEFCDSTRLYSDARVDWLKLLHRNEEVGRCFVAHRDLQYAEAVMLHVLLY